MPQIQIIILFYGVTSIQTPKTLHPEDEDEEDCGHTRERACYKKTKRHRRDRPYLDGHNGERESNQKLYSYRAIKQNLGSHGGEGLDELGYANISYAGLDSLSVFC